MKEREKPKKGSKEMELSDFFVFLFVLITIGLAIFVYNWSEEVANSLYLSELILKVSFILFVSSSHMESYCVRVVIWL